MSQPYKGTFSLFPRTASSSQAPPVSVSVPVHLASPLPPPAPCHGSLARVKHMLRRSTRSSMLKQPAECSIFPVYNPDVPLAQQEYAPAQSSAPTTLPRAVLNRKTYLSEQSGQERQDTRWMGRRPSSKAPAVPAVSSTETLRGLSKAANGWRAPAAEGSVYCLAMAPLRAGTPVYTFSSASGQPFFSLRLDPTSASANLTLSRHDAVKPAASSLSPSGRSRSSSSSSIMTRRASDSTGVIVLSTTLEEPSRRLAPNDGLVAHLTPSRAPRSLASVTRASESARLVWDDDAACHFLVHLALPTPFRINVARNPAYSRIEFTLEHNQLPRPLAKLTRDGTGGGWLQVDTGIAAQIPAFFVIDVAVTALVLVAAAHDCQSPIRVESFEPPPAAVLADSPRKQRRSRGLSRLLLQCRRKSRSSHATELEIDAASQDSLGKTRADVKAKRPLMRRIMRCTARLLFKMLVWVLSVIFKSLVGVLAILYKCVGSKY
ncbi:hypothetical protein CDD81_7889 [Ophiocordyceps australis]|uniref:Uncharacterized protein n=1 Tax=Ophiocordyceps australis TaxID=1399860 RepID=A0A2C5YF12_9HYPO|nr:hypothetical protein CDD81_7889 [Ophiocordyceps australis]